MQQSLRSLSSYPIALTCFFFWGIRASALHTLLSNYINPLLTSYNQKRAQLPDSNLTTVRQQPTIRPLIWITKIRSKGRQAILNTLKNTMRNRAGEAIADLTVVWRSGYVAKERKRKDPIHSKIAGSSGISRIKMPPPSFLYWLRHFFNQKPLLSLGLHKRSWRVGHQESISWDFFGHLARVFLSSLSSIKFQLVSLDFFGLDVLSAQARSDLSL